MIKIPELSNRGVLFIIIIIAILMFVITKDYTMASITAIIGAVIIFLHKTESDRLRFKLLENATNINATDINTTDINAARLMETNIDEELLSGIELKNDQKKEAFTRGLNDENGYLGSIDIGDFDSLGKLGHQDKKITEYHPNGNPYLLNSYESPQSQEEGVCIDNDAIAALDGDELNVYHSRARNDESRVIAGTMRRKEFVDRFTREELDEEENSIWHGNHEY
jgi:hypothetical protein